MCQNPFPASYVNATTRIGLHEVTNTKQTFVMVEGRFMTEHNSKVVMEDTWRRMHDSLLTGLNRHLQSLHVHDRKLRALQLASVGLPTLGMAPWRNGVGDGSSGTIGTLSPAGKRMTHRSTSLGSQGRSPTRQIFKATATSAAIQQITPREREQAQAPRYTPDFSDWAWPVPRHKHTDVCGPPAAARLHRGTSAAGAADPIAGSLPRQEPCSAPLPQSAIGSPTRGGGVGLAGAPGGGSQDAASKGFRQGDVRRDSSGLGQHLPAGTSVVPRQGSRNCGGTAAQGVTKKNTFHRAETPAAHCEGLDGVGSPSGEAPDGKPPLGHVWHSGSPPNPPPASASIAISRTLSMDRQQEQLNWQQLSAEQGPPVGVYAPPPMAKNVLLLPPSPFHTFGSVQQ